MKSLLEMIATRTEQLTDEMENYTDKQQKNPKMILKIEEILNNEIKNETKQRNNDNLKEIIEPTENQTKQTETFAGIIQKLKYLNFQSENWEIDTDKNDNIIDNKFAKSILRLEIGLKQIESNQKAIETNFKNITNSFLNIRNLTNFQKNLEDIELIVF